MDQPDLSLSAARKILALDADTEVESTFLRPHNHTWRLSANGATWYLKAHTKPWYAADPINGAADTVRHEITGHRILADAGLSTPEIVDWSTSTDNPLGWPYLLTRELEGESLVDLLQTLPSTELDAALRAVGAHLDRMHALTYDHPGYLLDGPPTTAPDPERWQHVIWRYERFLAAAFGTFADDRSELSGALMDRVADEFTRTLPLIRKAFDPPRYVHGDCHASQFYLARRTDRWEVTGVLDLEVSSAGCALFDWVKLGIELAGYAMQRPYPWWTTLFEAYEPDVPFELLRMLFVAAPHINYTCLGERSWPGTRADVVEHLITATDWAELFDLRRLAS